MRGYMREFLRVLCPGGLAVFDVPEGFVLDEELPPEAWRASLSLVGTIGVRRRPSRDRVAVDPGGECEVQRTSLHRSTRRLRARVDLLQALIGWFGELGSSTLKVPVVVAAEADARAPWQPRRRSAGRVKAGRPGSCRKWRYA